MASALTLQNCSRARYVKKKWIYKTVPSNESVHALSKTINVNPYLSSVLLQRGIVDFDTAKNFFRPSLKNLHDPFLMKGMDRAVARLRQAIERKEKILIYGDYDVDGVTAIALVYRYFERFYPHCDFYVPDRLTEGYGLSKQGVQWASEHQFSLILTLDLGTSSAKAVSFAKQQGIDVIICDHHLPSDTLPEAVALLNPKQKDCRYPFSELSGCGLGFKLIQALSTQNTTWPDPGQDIDLVAVSIASDLVPICAENRILAYHGLKKLNSNPIIGLSALKKVVDMKSEVKISDIVFKLAPRINAVGRVSHAREAIKLMLARDESQAMPLAMALNNKNEIRKKWDTQATEEALSIIDADPSLQARKSTVLYNQHWKQGVIGIVASRCIEAYYKPTIMLTKSDGNIVGSGRSVKGFDLYRVLYCCRSLLDRFGGHKYAVGLTLQEDHLEAFQRQFEKEVSLNITDTMLVPTLEIDMEVLFSTLNPKFLSILEQIGPFGPENPKPVFVARKIVAATSPVLSHNRHIRFLAKQNHENIKMNVIGFNMAFHYDRIANRTHFDMAFTIEKHEFRGYPIVTLHIKDIKFVPENAGN